MRALHHDPGPAQPPGAVARRDQQQGALGRALDIVAYALLAVVCVAVVVAVHLWLGFAVALVALVVVLVLGALGFFGGG